MTTTITGALGIDNIKAATGAVLQVVSTTYTGTVASTSATPANVTGFSAVITPKSTTSTILVSVSVAFGFVNDAFPYVLLTRNGVSIGTGVGATGVQINTFLSGPATNVGAGAAPYMLRQYSKDYEDSPSSTSQLTYQIQFSSPYGSLACYINRQAATNNAVYIQHPTSSITLMEIAG
tara:strand:+ start:173 stop:706 length:534 start_codon:yes stop_codon:yes gene_type:complete